MASADPSVSAKPKKTKRGSTKRQKRNKNSDGGRDEQAEIPSSSNRPRAEDIQSGMSQLRMTRSDDEDPSVKKFHDMQKERHSHLQFPTDKDSKALDRGEEWAFARGAVAKQWVCEQKVEVLDKSPPERGRDPGACCGDYDSCSSQQLQT